MHITNSRLARQRSNLLLSTALTLMLCQTQYAKAAQSLNNDFETIPCNTALNDRTVEGVFWDTYFGTDPNIPEAIIRCSITSPRPRNYVEFQVTRTITTNGIGPEIAVAPAINVVAGKAYYLAAFFRFQRVNGLSIWHDTGADPYSFDKLLEFRGSGFRWGIGAGWNGNYSRGTAGKFVFDAWYAESILGAHGPDHIVADQSPYNSSNPLLSDYEVWHPVVLGVTAAADNSGRVQLWVDGKKVIDQAHYTANAGATITTVWYTGTVAQPAYDAPSHIRQVDGMLITDVWQDIVGRGYLIPPGGGTTRLRAPVNLRFGT